VSKRLALFGKAPVPHETGGRRNVFRHGRSREPFDANGEWWPSQGDGPTPKRRGRPARRDGIAHSAARSSRGETAASETRLSGDRKASLITPRHKSPQANLVSAADTTVLSPG
jgi:hypothetical protein